MKVAAVIPALNEERLISRTLDSVPDIFDKIYVIDDGSSDETAKIVTRLAQSDSRITLVQHTSNKG
ncbi:MAG: glycosyltransferase family 2 protein, partial [Candidatus Thorarchaeota archaeon]